MSKTTVKKTEIGGKLSEVGSQNGGHLPSKPDVLSNRPAAVSNNSISICEATLKLRAAVQMSSYNADNY